MIYRANVHKSLRREFFYFLFFFGFLFHLFDIYIFFLFIFNSLNEIFFFTSI